MREDNRQRRVSVPQLYIRAGDACGHTPFSYMYTLLGTLWGPVRLGTPGGSPEARLVLGFNLGVRVNPGYI